MEEGEDLAEAARRELAEETGFVPSALKQIDYSYSFPMQDEWQDVYAPDVEEIVVYVFLAFVDEQQEPAFSSARHVAVVRCGSGAGVADLSRKHRGPETLQRSLEGAIRCKVK